MKQSYLLTIEQASLPLSLMSLGSVARVLRVGSNEAAEWCRSGQLVATYHHGDWWVSECELRRFVECSTWKLVAPPALPVKRRPGRR